MWIFSTHWYLFFSRDLQILRLFFLFLFFYYMKISQISSVLSDSVRVFRLRACRLHFPTVPSSFWLLFFVFATHFLRAATVATVIATWLTSRRRATARMWLPKEIQFLVNRIIMSMLNVAIKATLRCTCAIFSEPQQQQQHFYPMIGELNWQINLFVGKGGG